MGETTQVSSKVQQVLDLLASMTNLETAELVKEFEKKFGVSAAPVAVAAAGAGPAAAAAPAPAAEEKTDYDVILVNPGANKLQVIKVVREFTTLGLKEAKALVDSAPKPVKEAVSKEEAEKIKAKLEEAGAKVEVK